MKRASMIALLCALNWFPVTLSAQSGSVVGTLDTSVPRPPSVLRELPSDSSGSPDQSTGSETPIQVAERALPTDLGNATDVPHGVETAATQELGQYFKAVGAAAWSGLQAQGSMRYGPDAEAAGYPSILTVSKNGDTRLDVNRQDRSTSLRISGFSAGLQKEGGRIIPLPLRNAMLGVTMLPRLLARSSASQLPVVADGGMVELDGKNLHKVSWQEVLHHGKLKTTLDRTYAVSDLYFDNNHLLYKSAATLEDLAQTRQQYLEVITYTDYRNVNGVSIPFHMAASLEGQPSWTFTITSVSSNPTDTQFTF